MLRSIICPQEQIAAPPLPFWQPEHELADYWLQQYDDRDRVLVAEAQIQKINHQVMSLNKNGWPTGRWDIFTRPPPSDLKAVLQKRIARVASAIRRGTRYDEDGRRVDQHWITQVEHHHNATRPDNELRGIWRSTPLRCHPIATALLEKPGDIEFDQVQCAQLQVGEVVRVIGKGPRYWYVWSDYADGWVDPTALTPAIPNQSATEVRQSPRYVVVKRDQIPLWRDETSERMISTATLGQRLPLAPSVSAPPLRYPVQVFGQTGLVYAWVAKSDVTVSTYAPLTRREFYARALSLLHTPYGWGGVGARRDCSQLLMDLFASFGIFLPRNSAYQAQSGTQILDVRALSERDKFKQIQQAGKAHLLLLSMPGHIMLYLGHADGRLYAFHQFHGYLQPCPGGGETLMHVGRAAVTALNLGEQGSKGSYLRRIERLVIFDTFK